MTDERDPDCPPVTNGNGNDITLLSVVLHQMTVMESRLLARMDGNAAAAKDRWRTHDEQHDEWEKGLRALGHRLDDHLRSEREDELRFEARVGPIRWATLFLAREWRTIAIAIAFALTWLLATFEHPV
jgi:hypothetical protein